MLIWNLDEQIRNVRMCVSEWPDFYEPMDNAMYLSDVKFDRKLNYKKVHFN